jgi:menaquinone-dependent protoporphyrinogen oxidase
MKISIVVASRHGSTREIADVVADELEAGGHEVTVHDAPTASILDLDDADAILLGSAVYHGRWLMSATVFTADLSRRIEGRPVWLFSSGPVGDPAKPDPGTVDVTDQVEQTGAIEHRVFAGRLVKDDLRITERAMTLALRAPEGDFRDWDEVKAWARSVSRHLASVGDAA